MIKSSPSSASPACRSASTSGPPTPSSPAPIRRPSPGSPLVFALAAFVAALDSNRYTPLYIRGSGLSATALVKAVLEGLKIDPPFFSGQASQLFFKTIPELNRKPVVIIDDAQDLAATALTAIKSMVLCRPTEYAA